MKHSKFKILFAWLTVIAIIFSNLPIQGSFANENTGKDVTNRLVFDDAVSVSKYETVDGEVKKVFIYDDDGNPVGSNIDVPIYKKITIKYKFSVPQNHFSGSAFGSSEKIKPNDYFKIQLPSPLRCEKFETWEDLGEYAQWHVVKQGDAFFIEGKFNEKIAELDSSGAEITELKDGFFEIECFSSTIQDDVNLNLNTDGTAKPINFFYVLDAPVWNPPAFYKHPSAPEGEDLTWSLITSFDNFKYLMEQGRFYDRKLENGTVVENTSSPTSKLTEKKDIILVDRMPKGTKVKNIEIKLPFYKPTPEPAKNAANYKNKDLSQEMLSQEEDVAFVKEGQLSWHAQYTIGIKIPRDKLIQPSPGETLEDFITKIKTMARDTDATKGRPIAGIYEEDGVDIVVVGLGDSPNKVLTYEAFYEQKQDLDNPSSKPNAYMGDSTATTLANYLAFLRRRNEINDTQLEIMKKTYLNNGGDLNDNSGEKKIVAWSIGITATVQDKSTDRTYSNNAKADYRVEQFTEPDDSAGYPGGTWTSASDIKNINYYAKRGGITAIRRLSFPVYKEWNVWENGKRIEGRNEITVKVYEQVEGGIKKEIEGKRFTIRKDDGWVNMVTGLPLYDDQGRRITYSVEEVPVEGYTATVRQKTQGKISDGFVITNSKKASNTTSLKVEKVWESGSGPTDGVTVRLMNGGTEVESAKLNAANDWKYEFKGIDTNSINQYDMKEDPIPGYNSAKNVSTDSEGIRTFTFTNTALTEVNSFIDITVKKVWVKAADDAPVDNRVIVRLFYQLPGEAKKPYAEQTITAADNWTYTFKNLPKEINSKAVVYSLEELPLPAYETVVSDSVADSFGNLTFTVTNTEKKREKQEIAVVKNWQDGNAGQSAVIRLLQKNGSSFEQAKDVSGNNVPDLNLNASGQWSGKFAEVWKTDIEGGLLEYKVEEIKIDGAGVDTAKFEVSYSGNAATGFVVTNKHKTTTTTTKTTTTTTTTTTESEPDASSNSGSVSTTTTTTSEATTTTEATTESAVNTVSTETSPDASAETTTETTTETTPAVITTSETTTTTVAAVVIPTTTTTIPTTTRTFEFIEIFEDIPLNVRTTAPMDLELLLIEEGIPLTGLPYTGNLPIELWIGIGMLILTVGLTYSKKL